MEIENKKYQCIDVQSAVELIKQQDVVILDNRDSESFQNGHLPGAKHISAETIDEFACSMNKDSWILCVCYKGFSSQQFAQYFAEKGFLNVFSLNGGFEAWSLEHETKSDL